MEKTNGILALRLLKISIAAIVLLTGSWKCSLNAASGVPERIVLTWSGNPAESQSVVWRTEAHLKYPLVQWTVQKQHGSLLEQDAVSTAAETEEVRTEEGNVFFHYTADLTGLEPNTVYAYRVGSDQSWSEWNYFRTAAQRPAPMKIIYLGDVQNQIHTQWSGLIRKAYARAPDARCLVFAGDLVNRGKHDNEWGEFFNALGFIARTIPLVPVPGNHDCSRTLQREDGTRLIDPLYRAHFALPDNGPGHDDFNETTYYYDIQGVRLISFNSNSYADTQQLTWLKNALEQSTARWNIVVHHHPVFSTGQDRNNKELRALLMPVYERYGVDLVLQGHDHRYGRTGKIIGAKEVSDNRQAPVYVVSVSGSKAYTHNEKFATLMRVEKGDTQCYQILIIDGNTLNYQAWSLDDRLFDSFSLEKNGYGESILTEDIR